MRRSLLAVSLIVLVAGVVVSLAAGSGVAPKGRWVAKKIAGLDSSAYAVNGRGVIVGTSDNYPNNSGSQVYPHAVRWVNGRLLDLGTLRGTTGWWDYACGINDSGQIVGSALPRPRSDTTHAFLWASGKMRDLGTLGGDTSAACGINMRGQVVGWSYLKDGKSRAFVWSNGRMRPLATPQGRESQAVAVNERGEIVGQIWAGQRDYKAANQRAVVWRNGSRTDLPSLGGKESAASDINEQGQIVGWAQSRDGTKHAVLWQNGHVRDLGTRFDPSALNNRGQIVGACGSRACVRADGRTAFLGTVGYDPAVAADINDQGQIVGYAQDPCDECTQTFYAAFTWTWQPAK